MHFRSLVITFILFLLLNITAHACGACGCTLHNLGKDICALSSKSSDKKWYFEYLFDQTNWDRMDAREAHNLHHAGHDVHDKTTEDFHHFKVGRHITDDLNMFADIPYIIRRSLEVDDHAILGSKQKSQGWGDMQLIGSYRFWKKNEHSLNVIAGMQFPTGSTKEANSKGTLFEPELQPGLGSYNYILGGIYALTGPRSSLTTNTTYVFTTRGAQNFEVGDILTLSAAYAYTLNPKAKYFKTSAGIDTVFQYDQKDRADGVKSKDSGGQTMLAGPIIKIQTNDRLSFNMSLLLPVYQHLGGVHQQLDYEWNMGAKIQF